MLYTFTGGNAGVGLVQGTDGRLYGTTYAAGNGHGTVFALNPDGTSFTTLYAFAGGSDGAFPASNVLQGADGRLYGTTSQTGIGNGTVFAINPDGTGFATLYSFTGGSDGSIPDTSLIQGSDGRLYGSTSQHGAGGNGTLFAISIPSVSSVVPSGSTVTLSASATGMAPLSYQWQLNGANISGATNATLVLAGVDTTNAGSYAVVISNLSGSVTSNADTLAVTVPPTPSTPVFTPAAGSYSTAQTVSIASTGATSIYYTTDGGTPTSASTLYTNTGPVSITANTMLRAMGVNAAGPGPAASAAYVIGEPTITSPPQIMSFSLLHSFTNGNDGSSPQANLIQGSDGRLYGTSSTGGSLGGGAVFAVNPDGTGFTVIYSFTNYGAVFDPQASLIQGRDGRLYGTANYGGTNGPGTIFGMNPDGSGFAVLHNFKIAGNDGAFPGDDGLMQGADGRLYGMARQGGTNGSGVIYALNADGTGFTVLHSFTGGNDGGSPDANLIQGVERTALRNDTGRRKRQQRNNLCDQSRRN